MLCMVTETRKSIKISAKLWSELDAAREELGMKRENYVKKMLNQTIDYPRKEAKLMQERKEIQQEVQNLRDTQRELRERFEDEKSNYVKRLEVKVQELEEQNSKLRDLI